MWVRELQKQYNPAGLPWHVVRFAEVENGDYLGLRLKREGKWDVVFIPVECTDADFLPPKDTETQHLVVLDVGFRDWLLRMCNSDGWPVSCTNSTLMFGDGPPGQRVMPRSRRG